MRLTDLARLVVGMALVATPAKADVHITIANGHVTLSATDATPRQILTEWARVGQTRIVNIDRISGSAVSLEFTNVPEAQALDTLLRAAGGYLAAPRAVALPSASQYDRIYVLPTQGSPARPVAPPPVPAAQPRFPQPQQAFVPPDNAQDNDEPAPGPQPAPGSAAPQTDAPRGPIFGSFPQPRLTQRDTLVPAPVPAPASGTPSPSVPVGVSTPGLLVPSAQPPAQDQAGRAVRR